MVGRRFVVVRWSCWSMTAGRAYPSSRPSSETYRIYPTYQAYFACFAYSVYLTYSMHSADQASLVPGGFPTPSFSAPRHLLTELRLGARMGERFGSEPVRRAGSKVLIAVAVAVGIPGYWKVTVVVPLHYFLQHRPSSPLQAISDRVTCRGLPPPPPMLK